MPDRIAYPALALIAAGLVALALVWPQGQGAPAKGAVGRLLGAGERPANMVRALLPLREKRTAAGRG